MAKSLFLHFLLHFMVVLFVNFSVSEAATFTSCSNKKHIDKVDDVTATCELSNGANSLEWSLKPDGGAEISLATCNGAVCTNNGRATFSQDGSKSTLTYSDVTIEEKGKLLCKEGGQTAECDVNVVYVSASCPEKKLKSAINVKCLHSNRTPNTVRIERSGFVTDDVTCASPGSCGNAASGVAVTRQNGETSYKIESATRAMQGDRMTCTFTDDTASASDNNKCTINLYHPATIENCRVSINSEKWEATMACEFTLWWAGSGEYEFMIDRTSGGSTVLLNRQPVSSGVLQSYTEGGESFRKGTLSGTFKLPADAGGNEYRMNFYPGGESEKATPTGAVTIVRPGVPSLTCTSKFEESINKTVTTCSCSIIHIGSPEGRLGYRVDEKVVHWGAFGTRTLDFPSTTYKCSGFGEVQTSCFLDWVEERQANGPAQTVSCIRSSSTALVGGLSMVGGLLMYMAMVL